MLSNIAAGYGRTEVLHDVSLQVPAGSAVALLGSNGAGKTTLLKTIAGLVTPTSGRCAGTGTCWATARRTTGSPTGSA